MVKINVETLKTAPSPFFGRLVRSSTHGHSFVRLQYMHTYKYFCRAYKI